MVVSAAAAAQKASDFIAEPSREALRQPALPIHAEPEQELEAG